MSQDIIECLSADKAVSAMLRPDGSAKAFFICNRCQVSYLFGTGEEDARSARELRGFWCGAGSAFCLYFRVYGEKVLAPMPGLTDC